MKISYLLSRDLAKRMLLVHPPEPKKEMLYFKMLMKEFT